MKKKRCDVMEKDREEIERADINKEILSAEEKENILRTEMKAIGIDLSDDQVKKFLQYYTMLIETNRLMNLTAITDYRDVVKKHFVDSLTLVRDMDLNRKLSLIDVGTGAGFPGIPLKIVYPELNVTLLDSLGKRVKFLGEVIESLGLTCACAVHGRAEDFAREKAYREKFDLCTSRAVARLSVLSEYCLPFVRVGGIFASYKSSESEEEIKEAEKAIKVLGGKREKTDTFTLDDMGRTIVLIRKVKNTPPFYPRKAGTPGKKPIH